MKPVLQISTHNKVNTLCVVSQPVYVSHSLSVNGHTQIYYSSTCPKRPTKPSHTKIRPCIIPIIKLCLTRSKLNCFYVFKQHSWSVGYSKVSVSIITSKPIRRSVIRIDVIITQSAFVFTITSKNFHLINGNRSQLMLRPMY